MGEKAHRILMPVRPSKVEIAFSSMNFMIVSTRSVHAASSTSTFRWPETDGKGRMYSAKICSIAALDEMKLCENGRGIRKYMMQRTSLQLLLSSCVEYAQVSTRIVGLQQARYSH